MSKDAGLVLEALACIRAVVGLDDAPVERQVNRGPQGVLDLEHGRLPSVGSKTE